MSKDLETAAIQVINFFNQLDYVGLEGTMDSNVILKKVLHPGSVTGIGNVSGYLDNHMKLSRPKLLNPDGISLWSKPPSSLKLISTSTDTYGRASGTGI